MTTNIWEHPPAPQQHCPTPEKLKFPTREQAERKIGRLETTHGINTLRTYLCPGCGWWHTTKQENRMTCTPNHKIPIT